MTKSAKIIETPVFTYDRLDESAQERAREWWLEGGMDYDWWDAVYDDFDQVAAIFGLTLTDKAFSGFYCQGDGASFEGSYAYRKGLKEAVREYAPNDDRLHQIADELVSFHKRHGYGVTAEVQRFPGARYVHECTMNVSVYSPGREDVLGPEVEDPLKDIFRDLAHWLYRSLELEYEYLTSAEAVSEALLINEYTFTEEGQLFG